MITKKDDYNNVPVKYCGSCFDLKILLLSSGKNESKNIEYCGKCGSAEIKETHIDNQIKLYEEFHGKKLISDK